MKTQIDQTPAPPFKPFAQFTGTTQERMQRSPSCQRAFILHNIATSKRLQANKQQSRAHK